MDLKKDASFHILLYTNWTQVFKDNSRNYVTAP